MTDRWSSSTALKLAAGAALVLLTTIALGRFQAGAHPVAHPAASSKKYSAPISYAGTTNGKQQGGSTVDIDGHGSFSAKLGSTAKLVAAVMASATGIPYDKIAAGGTYKVQSAISSSGVGSGVVVAKFKSHGLGTACLTYTDTPGTYSPSLGYVPITGKLKMVGGSGSAAHWNGSVSFSQGGISGSTSLEKFLFSGALKGSTGRAHKLTSACKRVAKL